MGDQGEVACDANNPKPGDVFTFAAGDVRVDAVENGQVYFVSWRNGQDVGTPKRMTLDVWREACSWHSDDPPQPTMTCPKCKVEMPDFDGFGVLAHLKPDGCGYCRHMSRDGGVCNYCGDVEPLGVGPINAGGGR